jgi:hypothetical protein
MSKPFREFGVVRLLVGVFEVAHAHFPTIVAQELANGLQFEAVWLRHDDTSLRNAIFALFAPLTPLSEESRNLLHPSANFFEAASNLGADECSECFFASPWSRRYFGQ